MPTYEYACQSCGRHVEVYQRFNDEPLKVCPTCGGELRKVFHPAGILFKGSGFYKTDSRSSKSTTGTPKSPGTKEPSGTKEPAAAGSSDSASSGSKDSSSSSSSSTRSSKPKERSA
jgi:putative FmdB family regulatory protein